MAAGPPSRTIFDWRDDDTVAAVGLPGRATIDAGKATMTETAVESNDFTDFDL